ncbi:crossover junction endodeoxyribonuclease RuvC family protein [Blastomonas sp. RAC04]|nr:crossover junction endodeoxyribonuclease RuvC family protein [Blastomonas sp. RAC04]
MPTLGLLRLPVAAKTLVAGVRGIAMERASGLQSSTASKTAIFLGLDPGLSFTGFAVALVDIMSAKILSVIEVGVIATERQKLKQVRLTSDGYDRARVHVSGIRRVIQTHDVRFVAMEMAAATRHIKPTFSFGVMTGIAASLEPPLIQVLPGEVKAVAGVRQATKRDIIAWALEESRQGSADWPTSSRTNKLGLSWRGRNVAKVAEHPADALAAIKAALTTDQFRLAANLFD